MFELNTQNYNQIRTYEIKASDTRCFTVGVACLFVWRKVEVENDNELTICNNYWGVLSAREAFKTPELVLKHITEGELNFAFPYKISKSQESLIIIGTM